MQFNAIKSDAIRSDIRSDQMPRHLHKFAIAITIIVIIVQAGHQVCDDGLGPELGVLMVWGIFRHFEQPFGILRLAHDPSIRGGIGRIVHGWG